MSLIALCIGCVVVDQKKQQSVFIPLSSDSLLFEGRIKHDTDSSTVYYSGSGITFNFKGTEAFVWLKDETGNSYFNVIVDGNIRYFKADTAKSKIPLTPVILKDTIHHVSILKRNEWANGRTWFYGLALNGELLAPPSRKRTIEFIGNSITAGYAIDDLTGGDSPDSIYTNNYYTYAAITARHFDANYFCTARSGIGIMVSWFPVVMPEVFDRLDPFDANSKWDFSRAQPDLVVINLMQNDSWLVKLPEHESFKQRFGKKPPAENDIVAAYRNFVTHVRDVYPDAHIICALGSMDATKEGSPWPSYVKKAVAGINDDKVHTLFFSYINKGGHPRRDDNTVMADTLIAFINRNVWK